MSTEKKLGDTTVRVVRDDLTAMDVEAFVFYAQHDLALGAGVGNAIAQRGGPKVAEELKEHGPLKTTEVVTTGAGELKAKHIIHAVGPRFQERDTPTKLRQTMANALAQAQEKGIGQLAVPPMGVGFYGVPLPVSAKETLAAVREHLGGSTSLKEVIICCTDYREMKPFQDELDRL